MDKEVKIVITEAADETNSLLATRANRECLAKSIKEAEEGEYATFTIDELQAKYTGR